METFKKEEEGGDKKDHTLPEKSFLFLLRDQEGREKVLVGEDEREMKTCLFSDC